MGTNMEDLAGLVGNLSIAAAPLHRGQEPRRSTGSHPVSLQDAVRTLIQSTNTITSQSQSIRSLTDDAKSSGNLSITEVCLLSEGIKKLTDIASHLRATVDELHEATERSVIRRLRSLGNPCETVSRILKHFDRQIRNIVRNVLNHTSDRDVLWKVAEECYKQATNRSGILDADDYFIALEGASLGWPYDSDFESEEYYEHENRLDVDEGYATAFQLQVEHRSESRRKERQRWTDFWVRVVNNSPAGPTLFYPPASFHAQHLRFEAVPKYLFRTFDDASSGISDQSVIASIASISGSQRNSRTDILTLESRTATELLYAHLDKSCFGGEASDNLMSWTSSLLFAIQYAVWRLTIRRCSTSDIKICVVDTRDFPQGQFAQDIWLLQAYEATAKRLSNQIRGIQWMFDSRLERGDYYNGEYLSQGAVNITSRSCIVSLEQLIQAGLFQLYPEFDDPEGRRQWTKRVIQLRQNWSAEQVTTDREIELAVRIARNCFTRFEANDIALVLLTFKNRRCKAQKRTSNVDHVNERLPGWADKPDEVRRYWIATEAINSSHHMTLLDLLFLL
ncbi:uncharacterized protein EI97DRAFT_305994 [Westerdykella ornata]|uniref:DUF7587 domain-containing protein n=1 Tax=Westerdykella ornata TaxID=318751 RepID=A0A6A6JL85_WESOR|nr:uncharacterized protein EI97DRAFT_305994 [Westerdykella ornata]KAF2277014.1 hypothetical protein EI97DRAFT_305994 [Westerdykella ornata]